MRRYYVLFIPFLLILASLLQLNYIASMIVSPAQILRPLIVLWLLLGLLVWPAYWITRDWAWTSLLLSVLVIGFTFSSDFFITLSAFLLIGIVLWLAFVRLRRKKIRLKHFITILGGTAVFFILFTLGLVLVRYGNVDWGGYRQAVMDAKDYSLPPASTPANRPDIYYIVLDGYARADILQEMYGFDNAEFISYLEKKGFFVPSANHSNYPATPLSIASTLNMDYIQSLAPSLDGNPFRWLMEPFIDRGRVRAFLESRGYQTASLSTNWTITENATTNHYLHAYPVMLTDFEGYILGVTPLRLFTPLLGSIASPPTAEGHRQVIRYSFETLSDLPGLPGPKFVFAHIISPHPPFVFDQDGNPADSRSTFTFQDANEFTGSREEYRKKYVEQVQFVNGQLEKTIDSILAKSSTPPIILLQADHGPGMLTNLGSAENTCIHERFSPFAAYYLPGADRATVPDDISNVNLFRLVLNEYFDAGLPLLENRQYFNKDMQHYYDFEEVSGRIKEVCTMPKG
jgi:hypothetical protein